ncbi:MAG TPA: hypothetical protein VFD92_22190 [Candidatus Binatia bacterium]|nr:hypothetical protein [Candidatus Binatia bacterium]
MMRVTAFLTGLAAGGGLTYLFDPESGRRRRALARDRIERFRREAREAAEVAAKDAVNRAWGTVAEVGQRALPEGTPPDEVLQARVKAALGSVVSHPRAIAVEASDGMVRLRGPVLAEDVVGLLARARSVRGVRAVEDELEVHETSEGVPALQGPARRRLPRQAPPAAQAAAVAGSAAVVTFLGGRILLRIATALAPQVAAAGIAALALSVARQESRSRRSRGAPAAAA